MQRILLLCFVTLTTSLIAVFAVAQDASVNYQEIAHKIVTTSAHVKPGEKVVVRGGPESIPLMEAITMETDDVGGQTLMILETGRVVHNYLANAPDQYLGSPGVFLDIVKSADVFIWLPAYQDRKAVHEGISQEREVKVAAANQLFLKALKEAKVRTLYVNTPGLHDAEWVQMNKAAYDKMQWDAINADYTQVAQQGERLKQLLAKAKMVKITSPTGTNFTLSPGGRPVFVDAGIAQTSPGAVMTRTANLPGGYVIFAPIETSGNGRFVVPKDTCQPYETLRGATYEFSNGKLTSFKAEQNGQCFQEMMAASSGAKDMLASVSIGLNPAIKVNEDTADYRDTNAAGMVMVGMGRNDMLGGKNETTMGWFIPVTKATVEVDGKVVVKDGELMK